MPKVTFQCKRSGNFVSFTNDDDIRGLRQHEGYREINNAQTTETIKVESQQTSSEEVLKRKPGRPAKAPTLIQG